jgi:uncharacterized protein YjbJ (UPF0337 family)
MGDKGSERMKATGEEIKGKAQKAWGDMTDDERLQAEGEANETKGELRHAKEDAKDFGEHVKDSLTR